MEDNFGSMLCPDEFDFPPELHESSDRVRKSVHNKTGVRIKQEYLGSCKVFGVLQSRNFYIEFQANA